MYGYGSNASGHSIEFLGTDNELTRVFLFAPDLPLKPNSGTHIVGTAWVRTWIDDAATTPTYDATFGYLAGGLPVFKQRAPLSFANLQISAATNVADISSNQIKNFTSINRCDVVTDICN